MDSDGPANNEPFLSPGGLAEPLRTQCLLLPRAGAWGALGDRVPFPWIQGVGSLVS